MDLHRESILTSLVLHVLSCDIKDIIHITKLLCNDHTMQSLGCTNKLGLPHQSS